MNLSVNSTGPVMTPPIEFLRDPSSYIPQPAAPQSSSGSASDSAGSVSVSPPAQFLSDLQSLQTTQPQKVQAALTQAASGLDDAAQQAGPSTPQGQFLANSAAQLKQVASGGSASLLQPQTPANAVEQAYRSNEIGGGQGVLALLSSQEPAPATATKSTDASTSPSADSSTKNASSTSPTSTVTVPDLFAQLPAGSSNGSLGSVSDIIKQLQKALSS